MTVLTLVTSPDPRLKQPSAPVTAVDDAVRRELEDMLETMYASRGIGLAAVQVGIMKAMLVMDVEQGYDEVTEQPMRVKPLKFINPEIIWTSEELNTYQEGCLSFPAQYADVDRPKEVKVRYLDEHGKTQEIHADGLLATCLQHEIDHTKGITFVDHISLVKRDMILRKMKKMQKTGETPPPRRRSPYAKQPTGDVL